MVNAVEGTAMSIRAYVACLILIAGCSGGSDSKTDAPAGDAKSDAPIDMPPPTYDNCAGATELTFSNGIATGTANTMGAADDTAASCGGTGGPDVVFKFTTTMIGTLLVDVRPTNGASRAVISLRSDCGNAATEFGGCAVAASPGGGMLEVVRGLGVGTYYLWIDSADGQPAQFDVSMLLSVNAGDSCAGPIPMAFTSGEVNVAASTTGSLNDESGSCSGFSGFDNVFRFDLATASNFDVNVTPKTAGTQPVVYLQSSCAGGDLGCAVAASPGANAFLRLGSVPAGTQFLWIDGANTTSGLYNFTARVAMPGAGDTCALASPLTFTNGTATATGDTSMMFHDGTGSCASGTAPDAVYTFTTTAVQNLRVDVTTTSSTYQPVVYLRSSTCTGGELACAIAPIAGGTSTLTYPSLPVGTYYLWVDGASSTGGPFAMTAILSTPAPGDNCAIAKPLTFTAGMATDTGNTATWLHDSTGTCASGTAPDGVYTFTTSSIQDLRISVSTTTGTYQPVVYVRSANCTAGTQLGCGVAPFAGGTATLDIPALPIGTYYLWIDGAAGTAGAYSLTATLSNPLPGDHCTNPTPLVFSGGTATATGDTTMLFNDGVGTCASGTAPDVIYSFTTSAIQDLRVTVTTTTGTYQPVVYLRSASCTGSQVACGAATMAGGSATFSVGALPVGTYYLWIDGVGTTAGAYSLTATLTNPLPGDHCTNATPLTFTSGMASASGDTTMLFNDGSSTCASGTAPDVIYSFTTSAIQDLRVTVTTTTGTYQPNVYLRSATCTGTQLGCGTAVMPGGSATFAVGGLPVGTYYLWIDGVGTTAGAYSLSATLTAPQPGDTCTNPTALMFSNGMAGGTAAAMGDTTNLFDNSAGTCGGSGGPDAVYSFTTDRALDFSASVSTTTSTYRPTMYLRSANCTSGTQLACNVAATAGGTANISVMTLPAGTYYLWVDSATATGGLYTLSANLVPLPPAEVRPVQPTDVAVPGPMAVGFEVVDRLGSVVTGDNTTRFTITANGSAVFASATQGSIISGAGTNSVVVQVSAGRITLNATDATAETVTYTATDSQGNGLVYPSNMVSQMSATQTLATNNTFNLTFAQRPSGPATLTVTAFGDFSSGGGEYLDLFMESLAGTNYGSVFMTGGTQCGSTSIASITIPQANLNTHLMDGIATIVTRASANVDLTLCGGDSVSVRLAFPTTNSAQFLP